MIVALDLEWSSRRNGRGCGCSYCTIHVVYCTMQTGWVRISAARQNRARCFGIYGRAIYAPPYRKITEVRTKNELRIYAHEKSCSCFLHRDMYEGNRLLRIINGSGRAASDDHHAEVKAQIGRRPILRHSTAS